MPSFVHGPTTSPQRRRRRVRNAILALGVAGAFGWLSFTPAPASAQDWLKPREAEEHPAVGVLRRVALAQRQFHAERRVDQDLDGRGEFGTLQELSGVLPARDGRPGEWEPLLPPEFGAVDHRGCVQIGEHLVRVYLPSATRAGVSEAKGTHARGSRAHSADLCELAWVAYAWPVRDKSEPTFCVNGYGPILRVDFDIYAGPRKGPAAGAAFSSGRVTGLHGILAVDAHGQDGRRWRIAAQVETDPASAERMALDELRRYEARTRIVDRLEAIEDELWVPAPEERPIVYALRALHRAQTRFRARSRVDADADGFGEFGTLQEVLARVPLRGTITEDGAANGSANGSAPPPLRVDEVTATGEVRQGGYLVRLYLPGPGGGVVSETRGASIEPAALDTDLAEVLWCAYAWPVEGAGSAFMINQEGELLRTETHEYTGPGKGPAPDAAFAANGQASGASGGSTSGAGGRRTASAIGGAIAAERQGRDGRRWDPIIPRRALEAAEEGTRREPSEAERIQLLRLMRQAGLPERSNDPMIIRRRSNDESAIRTLRRIVSAQALYRWRSAVDVDGDGIAEFGTFQELSGRLRGRTAADGGTEQGNVLSPPTLWGDFQTVSAHGEVERRGYLFQVYLPGADGQALHEVPGRAFDEGRTIDVDASERRWCAYAWPIDAGVTGRLMLAVNQDGVLLRSEAARYEGADRGPPPGAAFRDGGLDSIGGEFAVDGAAQDGNVWRPFE